MRLIGQLVKFAVFISGSLTLLTLGVVGSAYVFSNLPEIKTHVLGTTISITPTSSPTEIPTSTKYSPPPEVYIDPDPPVHCQIAPECGGGSIPLKKSECSQTICCLFTNKPNEFMRDRSKCVSPSNQQGTQTNYQIPTMPNIYNPFGTTVNIPTNTAYSDCLRANAAKRDVCVQTCDANKEALLEQQYTGGYSPYIRCTQACQTSNPVNCN